MKLMAMLLTLACLLPAAGPARAQVPNFVEVTALGLGSQNRVVVEMYVGAQLPAEWVGWVVDRTTLGVCGDEVLQLGEVTPFPEVGAAPAEYGLDDHLAAEDLTYQYRLYAVDAAGTRHYLPGFTEWPPAYYHFDYASRNNDGFVAEGTLTDLGWTRGIDLCPDHCWAYLSFISELPGELEAYVGTEMVVRLRGQLDAEFEGPYVSEVTGWSLQGSCEPVGAEAVSWDGLKARYR